MKKTQKKILGLLGLFVVGATTVTAALMPNPEASATTSVTDKIVVRVVGEAPNVKLTSPKNGGVYIYGEQTLAFSYENVGVATITVSIKDKNGVTRSFVLDEIDTAYEAGDGTMALDLTDEKFGFGEYVIKIAGKGKDGVPAESTVKFLYHPVEAEAGEDEDTGEITIDLDYDKEDENIKILKINVYDEKGNLVEGLSPLIVKVPGTSVEIPFAKAKSPSGRYTFEVIACDEYGKPLYLPYTVYYDYKSIPVPNTGSVLKNLNISRADYLITGICVFLIVGVGGAIFIMKHDKKAKRTRKRR